jgi:hypothetical protein
MRWMVKMGNFDEGTSEETGEGDRAVVLGRGWLDPGEKNGKGRDFGGTGTAGVPGEGEEDVEVGFLGVSLHCHVSDESFKGWGCGAGWGEK